MSSASGLNAPWHTGKGDHWARDVRDASEDPVAWCSHYNTERAHMLAAYIAAAPRRLEVAQRLAEALDDLLNLRDGKATVTRLTAEAAARGALAEWESLKP